MSDTLTAGTEAPRGVGLAAGETTRAGVTTSGTNLSTSQQEYWARLDDRVVVSSSQGDLRRRLGAQLDAGRVALALCPNLPGVLRQKPFWRGIHAVRPGRRLQERDGCVTEVLRQPPLAYESLDGVEVVAHLAEALDTAVGAWARAGRVT